MNINKINKYSYYALVFLILSDFIQYLSSSDRFGFNSTYFTAIFKGISLYYTLKYARKVKWSQVMPKRAITVFKLLFLWNLVTEIRGMFLAKGYMDWKFLILTNSFSFLVPFAMIFGLMFIYNIKLIKLFMQKMFRYGFVLLPFTLTLIGTLYAILMFPVAWFILFSAYFKRKPFILVMLVSCCSIVTGFSIRSNLLRIMVPCALLGVYYLRRFFTKPMIRFICYTLFFVPLILLYLGVTGSFNAFQPFENNKATPVVQSDGSDDNLEQDTRTGLYEEVLLSMKKNNSFIFGEGGAATYRTKFFDKLKEGRYGSEVGFLDALLYSGIIGVFLYLLVIIMACNYAINYSKNFLCKMLAIFLAFRWVLFFIEDVPSYNLNYYFIWIGLGLCFSNEFRALTDVQIKAFFSFANQTKTYKQLPVVPTLDKG